MRRRGRPGGASNAGLLRSGSPARRRRRGKMRHAQRSTFSASGLTMFVGVPLMKFTTLSKAAPKYIS